MPDDFRDDIDNVDGGVSDHGALTGLTAADHTQYHNDTRGDARYYTQTQLNTSDGDAPNTGSNRVSWDNLVNVPAGVADGVDNISDTALVG